MNVPSQSEEELAAVSEDDDHRPGVHSLAIHHGKRLRVLTVERASRVQACVGAGRLDGTLGSCQNLLGTGIVPLEAALHLHGRIAQILSRLLEQ
jgi:hypothetical protein